MLPTEGTIASCTSPAESASCTVSMPSMGVVRAEYAMGNPLFYRMSSGSRRSSSVSAWQQTQGPGVYARMPHTSHQ